MAAGKQRKQVTRISSPPYRGFSLHPTVKAEDDGIGLSKGKQRLKFHRGSQ